MRIVITLIAILGFAACTKHNPNVCCTTEADCAAQGLPNGSTCEQGLVCRGNQCIAETCTGAAECDPAAPYCVTQTCAEMCTDDNQCPGFGQAASDKFCVTGSCVSCRDSNDCTTNAPVCDMGACRACTAHADCASNLCDIDTGTCVAESTIAYASPTGSTTNGCTKAAPCALSRALAVVDSTRDTIKLADGTYTEAVFPHFTNSQTVEIYGPATLTNAAFDLQNGATLKLRDIHFPDGNSLIDCHAGSDVNLVPSIDLVRVTSTLTPNNNFQITGHPCAMTLRRVTLRGDANVTLVVAEGDIARGSTLVVDQSVIDGGDAGINLQNHSTLVMTNSVMMNQGPTSHAIAVQAEGSPGSGLGTGPSSVSFSTFYNTTWVCPDGLVVFASKNNVFLNEKSGAPSNTVTGTACVHSYDLVKPQSTNPNGANNILGVDPRFTNAASGDFHLLVGSPAIDAADPTATEAVDFDGIARPQGARRDMGAFEYKP